VRRDFTINGMLYDPLRDEVLDWVGGREDIRRKLVRTIGSPEQRFAEDRLRMLRAVRFASQFDYAIEEQTYNAIRAAAEHIVSISIERIRDELLKILTLPEGRGGRGVRLLSDTGLLKHVLPEVARLEGVAQPPQFHPEGDVFEHTCMMLDLARNASPELALGILLHDVGKPHTQSFDGRIRFDEHDRVGAEVARQVCQRLRMSNAATDHVYALVAQHMRMPHSPEMRLGKLKQFLALDRFEEHLELHRLDCLASHRILNVWEFLKRKQEEMSREEISPPALITGEELIALGLKPGPIFSKILDEVRERQLDGEITNREQALEFVRRVFSGKEAE
jgi:poly(A) polymerase